MSSSSRLAMRGCLPTTTSREKEEPSATHECVLEGGSFISISLPLFWVWTWTLGTGIRAVVERAFCIDVVCILPPQ